MKKFKSIIVKILLVFFIGLALFSAGKIAYSFYQEQQSAKSFEQISHLVPEAPVTAAPEQAPKTPAETYANVLSQNSDFVGWIKIEGTAVNYPVVQSEERNYYLRRGFDKKYNYYGVPYAAEHCDVNLSQNVVIYGHNMNNGTMFGDLGKYTSKSFYETHKYINFDTLESFGKYEIIAVLKTVAYSEDEFEYFRFESGTEAEFNEFITTCKEMSLYNIETTATYGDRLITLSTCEYTKNHGRLAIVAKRVEE